MNNNHPHDHSHPHPRSGPDPEFARELADAEARNHNDHDGHEGHSHGHGLGHGHGHGHEHRGGLRGFLAETFRPHSHDSADSVDQALESSALGIRAVKISLVALGVTAIAQALLVVVTGSVALLADTIHNFSDALTAIPLWIAFVLGRRRANASYTYGYGRAEDLAGVFIVAMIALSSVVAGYESVRKLIDPQPLTHPWVVVAAGLLGFAGNELVALYRIRVGRQIGSAALVADGLHARTDGFTSLAVVLGAFGVLLGFPIADPLVGILITIAILFVLRGAARDIYRRLMDAVDPDLTATAEATLRGTDGVVDIEQVRLRWVGHRLRAEAGIVVDSGLGIVAAHAIATEAHHRLLHAVPKLVGATVHVSPTADDGDPHQVLAHHHLTAHD
jgi:cation diffusion facilitator family transporter